MSQQVARKYVVIGCVVGARTGAHPLLPIVEQIRVGRKMRQLVVYQGNCAELTAPCDHGRDRCIQAEADQLDLRAGGKEKISGELATHLVAGIADWWQRG